MYQDRLQTNRVNGARFYPYGDEITSTSNDREKFATYTRDSYTGLDYADQRYYASTYGRFNTPDPYMASANAASSPRDPGSWNRYAYVKGDPVNRLDPRGLISAPVFIEDDFDEDDPWGGDDGGDFDYLGGPVYYQPQQPQQPGGGGSPPPPPTCEQQLVNTITGWLVGTPLAGEAEDFVDDAQYAGLNPLLLVAISGAESSHGKNAPVGSNNAFGLLHPVSVGRRTVYVPIQFATWNDSINSAASTVDKQFVNGNVTVAEMYSGLPGAYCVGSCSNGESNVASIFQALGGGNPNNPLNLLWPCKD